jgi:hypothetical protein
MLWKGGTDDVEIADQPHLLSTSTAAVLEHLDQSYLTRKSTTPCLYPNHLGRRLRPARRSWISIGVNEFTPLVQLFDMNPLVPRSITEDHRRTHIVLYTIQASRSLLRM